MADSGGLILISPILQDALFKSTSLASGQASLPNVSFELGDLKERFEELVELLTAIQAVVERAEDAQESDPAIRLWLQRLSDAVYDAVDILDEVDYYNVHEKVVKMQILNLQEQVCWDEIEIQSQVHREQEHTSGYLEYGHKEEQEQQVQEQVKVVQKEKPQEAEILSQNELKQEQVNTSFTPSINLTVDFEQHMIHRFAMINESLSEIREKVDFIELMIQLRKQDLATAKPNNDSFHLFGNLKNFVGRENEVSEILNSLARMRDQHRISGISIVGMAGIGKTTVASLIYRKAKEKELYDVVAWVSASEDFNVERILKEMLEFLDVSAVHTEGKGQMDEMLQYLSKKLEKKTFLLILDDLWGLDAGKWNVFVGHLSKIVDLHDGRCSIVLTTQSKSVASVTAEEKLFSMHKHEMRLLSGDECWSIIKKTVLRSSFDTSIQSNLEDIRKEIANRCGGLPLVVVFIGETLSRQTEIDEWMAIKKNELWLLNSEDGNKILSVLKSRSFDRLSLPLKKCFCYCSLLPKGSIIERDDLVQHWMAQGYLHQTNGSSMTLEDVGNQYLSDLLSNSFFQNEVRDSCGNIISCKMHGIMHDLALFVSKGETLIWDARCSSDDSADIRHLRVEGFPPWSYDASIPREVMIQRLRSLFLENSFISYHEVSEFRSLRCLKLRDYKDTFLPLDLGNMKYLKYLSISNGSFEMSESLSMPCSLETFKLRSCCKLKTLRIGLSIKILKIFHCYDLTSIQSIGELASLQSFELNSCNRLISLPIELGSCISLKNLRINYCLKLTSVPTMRGLSSLENLEISGCERWTSLTSLPLSLGSCISLQNLRLSSSTGLVSIPSIYGLRTCVSLESLELEGCDELESLSSELGYCISLQKLSLGNCPRIEYIPKDMKKFPSLVCLEIYKCRKLSKIPEEWIGSFTSLSELTLGPFLGELEEFPSLTSLQNTTLKILRIEGWPKLKSLPPQLEQFTALEELVMSKFDKVEILPEWLGNLSSLQRLKIVSFNKLRQLPSQETMQRLSNLLYLLIRRCQQYKRIYYQESSPELSKVSHIAVTQVFD